eukprot:403336428
MEQGQFCQKCQRNIKSFGDHYAGCPNKYSTNNTQSQGDFFDRIEYSSPQKQGLIQKNQQINAQLSMSGQQRQGNIPISSLDARVFGLENGNGLYNCYLNVVFQTLWHIDEMRKFLTEFSEIDLKKRIQEVKILGFLTQMQILIKRILQDQEVDHFTLIQVRREFFKIFYMEQLFDLNQKGDAAEAFVMFLKLLHQVTIEQSTSQKCQTLEELLDAACQNDCPIHSMFQICIEEQIKCECGFQKILQKYHQNNFMHVIYGVEYIEKLKQQYEQTQKQIKISEIVKSDTLVNECERKNCLKKKAKISQIIEKPYPKILVLNFNWSQEEIKSVDLLQLLLSLEDGVKMQHFYEVQQRETINDQKGYNLKAIVCYVGAHYLVLIRQNNSNSSINISSPKKNRANWRLFNDTKIEDLQEWYDVVNYLLDSKCTPTLIIYEETQEIYQSTEQTEIYMNFQKSQKDIQQDFQVKVEDQKGSQILPDFNIIDQVQMDVESKNLSSNEKKQSDALKILNKLKSDVTQLDIYIMECNKCRNLMMLHQQNCLQCGELNVFKDPKPEAVTNQIETSIQQKLDRISYILSGQEFHRSANLSTSISSTEIQNISSKEEEVKQSVLSQQDQIMKEEAVEKPKEEKQFITKWKCPDCNTKNLLENPCSKCKHSIQDINENLDINKLLFEEEVIEDAKQMPKKVDITQVSQKQIRENQNSKSLDDELAENPQYQNQQQNTGPYVMPNQSNLIQPIQQQSDSKQNPSNNQQEQNKGEQWDCARCKNINTFDIDDQLSCRCANNKCGYVNTVLKNLIEEHKSSYMRAIYLKAEKEFQQSKSQEQQNALNRSPVKKIDQVQLDQHVQNNINMGPQRSGQSEQLRKCLECGEYQYSMIHDRCFSCKRTHYELCYKCGSLSVSIVKRQCQRCNSKIDDNSSRSAYSSSQDSQQRSQVQSQKEAYDQCKYCGNQSFLNLSKTCMFTNCPIKQQKQITQVTNNMSQSMRPYNQQVFYCNYCGNKPVALNGETCYPCRDRIMRQSQSNFKSNNSMQSSRLNTSQKWKCTNLKCQRINEGNQRNCMCGSLRKYY